MRKFAFNHADNADVPHTYVFDTESGTTIAEFYYKLFGKRWAEIEAETLCDLLNFTRPKFKSKTK